MSATSLSQVGIISLFTLTGARAKTQRYDARPKAPATLPLRATLFARRQAPSDIRHFARDGRQSDDELLAPATLRRRY